MLIPIATKAELETINPISAIVNGGDRIISKLNEQKEFNKIVADTFTFDEYANWLLVQQKFEAKESLQNKQIKSCIKSGTDKRTCADPHWCLYPSNLETDECVWYKIKYNL